MNWRPMTLLALAVLATAACTGGVNSENPGGALDDSDARAAIDATRAEYVGAWRAADAARVASLYVEDALVLYPNQGAIAGRSAIHAYFSAFFNEFAPERFELISDEIQVAGTWAFDRGTYVWRGVPRAGGDPIDDNGKYLVILQRQVDGSWKVARDMDNSDRPLAQTNRSAG